MHLQNNSLNIRRPLKFGTNRSQSGFTLFEVVAVTGILAVLSAIVYGTISGMIRAKTYAEGEIEVEETAHRLLVRFTTELTGRSLLVPLRRGSQNTDLETDDEQDNADGTKSPQGGNPFGQTNSPFPASVEYFRGENKEKGSSDQDKLRFVSSTATQTFLGGISNHGVVEVEYRLEPLPDEDQNPSSSSSDEPREKYALVRDETPAGVTDKTILKKRRVVIPVAEPVASLNFRYLKNGKWENEWKNQPVPEAVEITVGLIDGNGKIRRYKTAVFINQRR